MTSSSSSLCSSSILNIPISRTKSFAIPPHKISTLQSPFVLIKTHPRRCPAFVSLSQIKSSSIAEAETSANSDNDVYDEEAVKALAKIGSNVRVKVPLKVYHVPKVPELEVTGKVGTLKQYVAVHKGKKISANLPYKVQFVEDNLEGRTGPVKFFVHLREDEFEYID